MSMRHWAKLAPIIWFCCTLIIGTHVYAREYEPIKGGALELGGFDLFPIFNVDHYYDSNVLRSPDNDIDSWVRVLSPELILVNEYDGNRFQLGYRFADGHYYGSAIDNYSDHFISAQFDLYANERHRFEISSAYELGHDARGTVFSIGSGNQLSTPDEYAQTQVDGIYFFGAEEAMGRLELNINHTSLDYDINTPAYLIRDRNFLSAGGTFYYRVAPATDALIELRTTQINYDFAQDITNPLDSRANSALIGVRWNSTRNTTGFAKIGMQQKNFDSSLRPDFSGAEWNVGVDWTPMDRTFLRLSTARDTFETNGEGNFIDNRSIALTWRHSWLERLRSELMLQYGTNTYEGNTDGFITRTDDVSGLSGSLDYDFRRWLTLQLGYQFEQRQSNRLAIDYDRHLLNLNIRVTL
jgi:hypothetical protein